MEMTSNYSKLAEGKIMELKERRSLTPELFSVVQKIKEFSKNGEYDKAKQLIDANKTELSKSMIDATWVNTMMEELRNCQIIATKQAQHVFRGNTIPECIEGDVWISSRRI